MAPAAAAAVHPSSWLRPWPPSRLAGLRCHHRHLLAPAATRSRRPMTLGRSPVHGPSRRPCNPPAAVAAAPAAFPSGNAAPPPPSSACASGHQILCRHVTLSHSPCAQPQLLGAADAFPKLEARCLGLPPLLRCGAPQDVGRHWRSRWVVLGVPHPSKRSEPLSPALSRR
ncbi:uncharacterized protein LOC105914205 [Setaria italica]|uniref:uncharacterized protein LOC105914205 n=1 Tax=Setaria italica TaxID=4555 RepID=UPI000646499F|nr:uncharacterized protein LOC105914205 [Setaria italica]